MAFPRAPPTWSPRRAGAAGSRKPRHRNRQGRPTGRPRLPAGDRTADPRPTGLDFSVRRGARTLMAVATPRQAPTRHLPSGPMTNPEDGLADCGTAPRHDQTVGILHALLLRVARHELRAPPPQCSGSPRGPSLTISPSRPPTTPWSIIGQARRVPGLSRFTTWAYKFVLFEVSAKVARHAWRRQPPQPTTSVTGTGCRTACPRCPALGAEQRELLEALSSSIGELTDRQRDVFVAVALNDSRSTSWRWKLDSNRNAIYKNLFDARRACASLAAAGHPVTPAGQIA